MMSEKKGKYVPGDYTLEVHRSRSGLGLYTNGEIPKGKCVIEYIGRRVSGREEYTSRSKYLFEVSDTITIDGTSRKNRARYINHSCVPNCEITIYKNRVYVMSRRRIRPQEELTYDYGKEYFDEHIGPKGCRCTKCMKKRK